MNTTDRIVCGVVLFAAGLVAAVLGWPFASAVIGAGTGILLVGLWRLRGRRGSWPRD